MRIGIDCRTILHQKAELAGVGHYTYNIVKNLIDFDSDNEYFLIFQNGIDMPEFKRDNVELLFFNFNKCPLISSHFSFSGFLNKLTLDIYFNPAYVIPLFYNQPSVITVHDLAIYRNPEWFPSNQTFSTKVLVPKSIKKAKKIIAVSESTKKDLIEFFKIEEQKIKVIYEGVTDYSGFPILDKQKFSKPFFLSISTIEPRKNLAFFLKVFKQFIDKGHDYDLVIAGKKGWKNQEVFDLIKDPKLINRVHYLGYISLEEKISLYKKAFGFVFPSKYEGFGLPVLEALSLDLPVIVSDNSSLKEIVNPGEGYLVKTDDQTAWLLALEQFVKEKEILSQNLKNRQQKVIDEFSWNKAAKSTLAVFKEL